jgi:hypothetical protein
VNPEFFAELRAVEARLGPPEPLKQAVPFAQAMRGALVEMPVGTGSRRSGFEHLRDIITRHRREWADRYLERYLRARWEGEVREAARLHAHAIAKRGKPPTAYQFAPDAAAATNHWFGGDLRAFYAAIGEKAPVRPVRVSLMPADRLRFVRAVFLNLGCRPFEEKANFSSPKEWGAQAEERDRLQKLAFLSKMSLKYIQMEEGLGRSLERKDSREFAFDYWAPVLSSDLEKAWQTYVSAIDSAKRLSRAGERPTGAS